MANDPDPQPLDDLAARIRQAERSAEAPKREADAEAERATVKASRIGFDFAATVLVCAFLGWLADRMLGTKPWGIIVMLFAGFAVGVMNVWRGLNGYDQAIGWRRKKGKQENAHDLSD
jgi:ATP synthase protein I